MGAVGMGSWIAKAVFLILVIWGAASGELRAKGLAVFLALGLGAWIGLPYLPRGADFVTPALAIVDIALVFAVLKRDIRIT